MTDVMAMVRDGVDIDIECVDCDTLFTWTVGEQIFFADKGLQHPPKRCKPCKADKNDRIAQMVEDAAAPREKIEHHTVCAKCGSGCTVPFRPTQGRPVYCRRCFNGNQVKSNGSNQSKEE